MRKGLAVFALFTILIVAPSAWASAGTGSASGGGKTHLGGTFAFNARADLHAEIVYHNGTLKLHCMDLHGYFTKMTNDGFKDATFASNNCTDASGNTYRVWMDAVDRGEPGTNDKLAVRVFDSTGTLLVNDRGYIQHGNIQVTL
jgi:hypothetical protein